MSAMETRSNILWSGENPIILLKPSANAKETTAVGFFRVDFSPAGTGHAAFVVSDVSGSLKGGQGVFACYTDRLEVAEWIKNTTIGTLPSSKIITFRMFRLNLGDLPSWGRQNLLGRN